jgi:hypothetical protein
MDKYPGQSALVGSGRKASELSGTWKQYSGRNAFEFLRLLPTNFLFFSGGKRPEITGDMRPEYCFHFPPTSGVFLPDAITCPHLFEQFP